MYKFSIFNKIRWFVLVLTIFNINTASAAFWKDAQYSGSYALNSNGLLYIPSEYFLNPCSIRFKGWPPHFQRVFLKKPAIHQNLNVAHQAFNGQNQPPSVALPSLSTEKPDTKTSKPLLRLETQSIASRPTFAEFIPMRNPAAPPIALANKRILLPRAMHAPSPATIAGPYGSPAPRDT